jgi:ABC-2 type transport system permease protein
MNTTKIFSFIKRDFFLETSYRFNLAIKLAGILFYILTFYFIAKLIGPIKLSSLESYGGDYFSFALIGIAFSSYLTISLTGFSHILRQEQMMGTLEALFTTPTSAIHILLASSLWEYISATAEIILFLLLGIFLKVDLSHTNISSALILVFLSLVSFSAIGILSASFIMAFKKGDPVNWLINNFSILLGGVYFPIEILPEWLQNFSRILPITYSLHGLRLALLQGASIRAVAGDIITLLLFAVILFPLSLLVFRYAVKTAKEAGTLSLY